MSDLNIFRSGERLDYTKMGKISTLPNKVSYVEFIKKIKMHPSTTNTISNNNVYFRTLTGKVKIYLSRAYGHFFKDGKFRNRKENRQYPTGSLTDILANPFFVTKDEQNKLYFYKPFKRKARNANGESEILDTISVSVEQSGKIEYRTTYKDKFNQTLDFLDGYKVVRVAR